MRTITVFSVQTTEKLEASVNEWLKRHSNANIIDIKYSVTTRGEYSYPVYSVLIDYTEEV